MKSRLIAAIAPLLVVVSMTALAAAPASAELPEFKAASGRGFTLHPVTMTGKSALDQWEWPDFLEGNYLNTTITGRITGPKTISEINITFEKPEGRACLNGVGVEKWIGLKGTLGYINKAEKKVGIMLEAPPSKQIAECLRVNRYNFVGKLGVEVPKGYLNVFEKQLEANAEVRHGTKLEEYPAALEGEAAHPLALAPCEAGTKCEKWIEAEKQNVFVSQKFEFTKFENISKEQEEIKIEA